MLKAIRHILAHHCPITDAIRRKRRENQIQVVLLWLLFFVIRNKNVEPIFFPHSIICRGKVLNLLIMWNAALLPLYV